MKTVISSKNFPMNDALKERIESKLGKFEKYFSKDSIANVMVSKQKDLNKIEVTFKAGGTLFRAEALSDDVNSSLDKVEDKLFTQITRFKSKLQNKYKNNRDIIFQELPDKSSEEHEDDFVIAKTKEFELRPMSPEEAILQMELLNHDFFIFMNTETGKVNVIYTRKNGHYGLINPKY